MQMIKFIVQEAGGVHIVSNKSEMEKLPKGETHGAKAFCIEDSSVHMFDESKKEWIEI